MLVTTKSTVITLLLNLYCIENGWMMFGQYSNCFAMLVMAPILSRWISMMPILAVKIILKKKKNVKTPQRNFYFVLIVAAQVDKSCKILSSTSICFGGQWKKHLIYLHNGSLAINTKLLNYLKRNIVPLPTTDSQMQNSQSIMLVKDKSSLPVCLP